MALAKRRLLTASACALLGCVLAGWLMATLDALLVPTDSTNEIALQQQWWARVGLFSVVGATLGVIAASIATLGLLLRHFVPPRARPFGKAVALGAAALLAAVLIREPLKVTLRGFAERQPEYAQTLDSVLIYATAIAAAVVVGLLLRAWRWIDHGRPLPALGFVVVLLVLVGVLVWGDLTFLVALYARAHVLLECIAWLFAALALTLICYGLSRRFPLAGWLFVAASAAALVWARTWLRDDSDVYEIDKVLAASKRQPGYGTRMRLRAQTMRDFLRDPANWQGAHAARMDRLIQRYDIATTVLAPKWDLPRKTKPRPLLAPQTPPPGNLNLVVVFVDTLRADIAADATIMPNLARLRARSLSFANAYSTASDTISALPVLTGGCYEKPPCKSDLLTVARQQKVRSGLIIAKSAGRFLAKQAPNFKFDDTSLITDYAEGKKVWGYGADQTSARAVSKASLKWLGELPCGQRFMLWSFHFDVHNWMQLDRKHLEQQARSHNITKDFKRWRYRAAAAGVDDAIGQLLTGLKSRGLAKNTAILLVSDHGEGLGRARHWQHAVYLWDSLVKVPLMLHIPGMAQARYQHPVGHVDVAPTLARLLDPSASLDHYHGVPLYRDSREHDLPLLLFSMRKNDLLRIGAVSRDAPYMKLELPINSAEPELYDATADDLTDVQQQHAARTLTLLSELVTSPVFPREEAAEAKP